MNCYFCNIKLSQFYTESSFHCNNCNASHYKNSHVNLRIDNILSHYDKPYFQFRIPNKYSQHLHYSDSLNKSQSRIIGAKGQTIIEWNYIPNINPSNISDKLKLYLTFL